MIFEMRTYLLKPGTVPQAEEAFATALPPRIKLSRLAGFWHTEVGTLNQIIHIWPYKDLNERDRIRAEAIEKKIWPPKTAEFILEMESKILHPAPFSIGPASPATNCWRNWAGAAWEWCTRPGNWGWTAWWRSR